MRMNYLAKWLSPSECSIYDNDQCDLNWGLRNFLFHRNSRRYQQTEVIMEPSGWTAGWLLVQEQKRKVASALNTWPRAAMAQSPSTAERPQRRCQTPPLKNLAPRSGPFLEKISGTVRCIDDFLILSSMREGLYLIHVPDTVAGLTQGFNSLTELK